MELMIHLGGCPPCAVVVTAPSGTTGTQVTIVVVPSLAGITWVVKVIPTLGTRCVSTTGKL